MDPWLSNPMYSLSPKTYTFQFDNLPFASGRNNTYICFQVEERKNNSLKSYRGVFRNQVSLEGTEPQQTRSTPPSLQPTPDPPSTLPSTWQPSHLHQVCPEEPLHAEQCFLSWFDDKCLSPRVDYDVTWYMSWSPCLECAEEVASFLEEHENVSLNISVSRLYKCDDEDEQQGLRDLAAAGAELAAMRPEDFKYCWDSFVDNRGWPFWYWKGIRRNYYALDEKLEEILWG